MSETDPPTDADERVPSSRSPALASAPDLASSELEADEPSPARSETSVDTSTSHDSAGSRDDEHRSRGSRKSRPSLGRSAVSIALLFGYGVLAAVLAAMPLTEVARVFYAGNPRGDAPLAEPGGLALADLVLGRGAAALSAALPTSVVLVVLGAVGAHLPFGAVIAHLAGGGRGTLREAYARSASRFFVLGSATLVSLAARAVFVVLALVVAESASEGARGKLDDRAADLVGLATLLPFGLVLFVLFVLTDLTYVAIVAHQASLPKAVAHAVRTLRHEGRRALIPAGLAYGGGLAALAVAGQTVGFLAISAPPVTLFLAHQGALLAKLVLRAAWLSNAIQYAPTVTRAESGAESGAESASSTNGPETP